MFHHPDLLRVLVADRHAELRRHSRRGRRPGPLARWRQRRERLRSTRPPDPPEELVLGA